MKPLSDGPLMRIHVHQSNFLYDSYFLLYFSLLLTRLQEGIRNFAKDTVKMEALIREKLQQ